MADQAKKGIGSTRKTVVLQVIADLLESERSEKPPGGVAYAFSRGGRLLASAELDKSGKASLKLPIAKEPRSVRVMVGPASDGESPRVSGLLRRGAEGRMMRLDPDQLKAKIEIAVIPGKWACWLAFKCFVPGKVMKRVEIDGIPTDLPVCGAEVEVYEVDPLFYVVERLPDYIIEKIRRYIIDPPFPPDGPFPPEGPFPPDGPFPPPPPPPIDLPELEGLGAGSSASESSAEAGMVITRENLKKSLGELRILAEMASDFQLREALPRFPEFTRLLLCRYFPPGVRMDLVATAVTDECGHFRAWFIRGCKNPDKPDLYFKVKQRWGPFTFTIYDPTPISCYTRWDYVCGTEVTLFTSSQFANTCSPCPLIEPPQPGLNWVAVMHIGNTPLSRIRGTSPHAGIQGSTNPTNKGLHFRYVAEANSAASFGGRPFGGHLRPHIEFDNSLREDLGVRYYSVSWRQGASGAFQPLNGEVHRHYSHEPPGATSPVFEVYSLGPQVVSTTPNLFEIPPALPPKGQWVVTDLVEDQTSAKFPTAVLAPPAEHGKYELKIDLYDAAGNLVNIDTLDVIFVVPEQLDLAADAPVTTVDADGLGLVVDDDSDGKKSFVMTVHVDNNQCTATVSKAELAGPANDCGVLEYAPASLGATVTMPYSAVHPNGFATYLFRLKRGVKQLPFSQSGTATPPGNFSQTATVGALTGPYPGLGLPACPVAAFSEHLKVWALATNGWSSIHSYDDDDHAAFVLSPEEE